MKPCKVITSDKRITSILRKAEIDLDNLTCCGDRATVFLFNQSIYTLLYFSKEDDTGFVLLEVENFRIYPERIEIMKGKLKQLMELLGVSSDLKKIVKKTIIPGLERLSIASMMAQSFFRRN